MANFGPLGSLCLASKEACDRMAPMVQAFYEAITGETAKLKADKSVFTIADGIVQHLIRDHLFCGDTFAAFVGEEDESCANITARPYTVEDLTVPEEFFDLIDSCRQSISALAATICSQSYKSISVFVDPIDGTREFSTGLGEQCSICIGFADPSGKPVAGIVYRPLTSPPTWAMGAVSEGFVRSHLDKPETPNTKGLLTSNGAISPFLVQLMQELEFVRVPSGGAGNKMLMLLEGKGGAYIQDRGVSRWDTCAAQAVIEAHSGALSKLQPFIASRALESYTYQKSSVNLDFIPGLAALTPYNASDKSSVKKGATVLAADVALVKPYSNLCGLFALDASCLQNIENIHAGILRAAAHSEPSYD